VWLVSPHVNSTVGRLLVDMQTFLYDEKIIELFRRLKSQPPERIFSEEFLPSYHVGFDYGERHIVATPKDFLAASQNGDDEAITIEFAEVNSPYKIHESERVILESPVISRVFILRTLLYFSDEIKYKNNDETLAKMTDEEKADPILSKLLGEATGGHDEIVCNPQSKEAAEVNPDFANLVDAGILLEIDGKCLGCFSNCNSFVAGGHIWSYEEISEDIVPYYEFIEVDP
jgi:hypothetical protein